MSKKVGVLFLVVLLVSLFSSIVLAQDLDETVDERIEELEEKEEKIREYTEEEKWEYLSKEWKNILLKNKFVSFVDGVLKKISFMFVALFGEKYDLSLTLLFVIILWVFFFYSFSNVLRLYSTFSSGVSELISLALLIIFAQLGILRKFSEIIFKIIFFSEGIWNWIWFFAFIFILVFIATFIKSLCNSIKKSKEKREEEDYKVEMKAARIRMKGLEKFTDSIVRAFRK